MSQTMTPELTVLALAACLQALQFFAYSILSQMQVGSKYAASPRDKPRELTGTAGRLSRALNNHFEGLILFTIAVVVVTLSGQSSGLTANAAWLFLAMRLLYIPAYLLGWAPWRSLIWFIGFLATMAMVLAALI